MGLHSNGDMSNTHYDMNLVYIDALFRHPAMDRRHGVARESWPVIERHMRGSGVCFAASSGRTSCRFTKLMRRSGPAMIFSITAAA